MKYRPGQRVKSVVDLPTWRVKVGYTGMVMKGYGDPGMPIVYDVELDDGTQWCAYETEIEAEALTWQRIGSVAKIEWDLPKLEPVSKWSPPRCECGSEAVGSNRHSSYCPKALSI